MPISLLLPWMNEVMLQLRAEECERILWIIQVGVKDKQNEEHVLYHKYKSQSTRTKQYIKQKRKKPNLTHGEKSKPSAPKGEHILLRMS